MRAWTAEQAACFLGAVREDRLYVAWLVLTTRGLRRGEMLGLRWSDVDLDAGQLAVVRALVDVDYALVVSPPKTRKGRRTIPLDALLVAALRAHRARQHAERLAWGPGWVDTGLVISRENAGPCTPSRSRERSSATCARPGCPASACTTCATPWPRCRCGPASRRGSSPSGWATTTSITDDLYRHVSIPMLAEAGAELTAAILGRSEP